MVHIRVLYRIFLVGGNVKPEKERVALGGGMDALLIKWSSTYMYDLDNYSHSRLV